MNPWLIAAVAAAVAALLFRKPQTPAPASSSSTDAGGSSSSPSQDQGGGSGSPNEAATADLLAALGAQNRELGQAFAAQGSIFSNYFAGYGGGAAGGVDYGAVQAGADAGLTTPYSYIGPGGSLVTPTTYASIGATPQPITSGMVSAPQALGGFPGGGQISPTSTPNIVTAGHAVAV